MKSRFQGYTDRQLEQRLKQLHQMIPMYRHERDRRQVEDFDKLYGAYVRVLEEYEKEIEEIEFLLNPKINYEDGSWV